MEETKPTAKKSITKNTFKFTPFSISKLLVATLAHRPFDQPHGQVGKAWDRVVEDVNQVVKPQVPLIKLTAMSWVNELRKLQLSLQNGKGPADLRMVFEQLKATEFASLLDWLEQEEQDIQGAKSHARAME
ncbi:hypothetical protein JAAARDRAFT_48773 [Jaapia argillacea MUCL 33604]|uniref:Uncharacterized protein n=1 Tax=Jaapia argillacea MUCL 33604 TaxID=933084 RepID=A0A067PNP4_9AGAM|nr:hypothetical protein JAAARDRAFT_48773 [Jaapia argillacea MUCL 33604]